MLGTSFDLIMIGQRMLVLAIALIAISLGAYIVRRRRHLLKHFILVAIVINVIYILWRLLFTIPTMNVIAFAMGILLFLAELFALIQTTTHRLMFMKDYEPQVKTLAALKDLPTVDILIATYNEPVNVLQNTIAAATNQHYPREKYTVYVCDDGSRESVRELAEKYGAVWSTREKHIHAKAGNLNHCLQNYAKSELFAVLDADMVPKSSFLERMVGYFDDPNMALVQAPQVFYNPDPFQYNLQLFETIPNEQDFFMREVLTRRGLVNAVLNVGSNALFRRSAIEAIGWIPVGTITEDMATSMLLQAKGFQTTFVNETLAMGLSPDTFSDYIVQRDRWCRGNIQVLKKWNPFTLPGLSFMQRLIYFDGVLYWFFGLQKLIYYLGPILFLLTGIPAFYANVYTMLMFFVPTYYISTLIFRMFNHKNRTYIWAHIYESALAPYLSLSALSELFFAQKIKFSVTPKGKAQQESHFAFRVALPHMVIAFFSIVALAVGIYKMLTDVNYMVPVYIVNLFWLLYNLVGVFMAIFVSYEKRRVRSAERFVTKQKLTVQLPSKQLLSGELADISTHSLAVNFDEPIPDADFLVGSQVIIDAEDANSLHLPGTIFRSRSWGKKLIINFNELNTAENTRLVNFIFDSQMNGYGKFDQQSVQFSVVLREVVRKWWKQIVVKK